MSKRIQRSPVLHRLAYDGRGNFVVRSDADHDVGAATLGGYEAGLYAEQFAPFVKELAVMVVRRCVRHKAEADHGSYTHLIRERWV